MLFILLPETGTLVGMTAGIVLLVTLSRMRIRSLRRSASIS